MVRIMGVSADGEIKSFLAIEKPASLSASPTVSADVSSVCCPCGVTRVNAWARRIWIVSVSATSRVLIEWCFDPVDEYAVICAKDDSRLFQQGSQFCFTGFNMLDLVTINDRDRRKNAVDMP